MIDENGNFYKPERGSAEYPDHIMLSFCGDAKTQMAVSWRTDKKTEKGYALLREENNDKYDKITAVSRQKDSDIDSSVYHTAIFRNLKPGSRYYYTVGNDEYRSEEYTFVTSEENVNEFSFMVISDHQKGSPTHLPDYSRVGALVRDALKKHPEVKFILTAGDNCDNGQNELQWNGMFSGLKGIIESIPYMMTTGNHDNRGFVTYFPEPTGKFYLEHADFFDFQFEYSYPQNGPEGYKTENYSFDYGNSHFTIMGINAPDKVGDWAYADMQGSSAIWKFATYHFPIYPVMPEGQNNDGYPWLRNAMENGRPDVVFNGHEHSFARTFPTRNDELFDKPSEGTVHYIAGNAGGNIYHSNAQKVWHSCFFPQEERNGLYAIAHVKDNVLTITAYMSDGRTVDKFVIDKDKDEILPYALAPCYDLTKMCFKGRMLELAARGCYAQNINGTMFAPIGVIIHAQGGKIEKKVKSLCCEMYGICAEFYEGSTEVSTNEGVATIDCKPYFNEGQLYVSCDDACRIFGLEWYYAERNNYINFNSPHEDKIIYKHPTE